MTKLGAINREDVRVTFFPRFRPQGNDDNKNRGSVSVLMAAAKIELERGDLKEKKNGRRWRAI